MANYFTPYAAKNKLVMVFPQAEHCWDTFQDGAQKSFTKDGTHMKFMKAIVERMQQEKPKGDYPKASEKWETAYDAVWSRAFNTVVKPKREAVVSECHTKRDDKTGDLSSLCKYTGYDVLTGASQVVTQEQLLAAQQEWRDERSEATIFFIVAMVLNFLVLVGISVACFKYKEPEFSQIEDEETAAKHE